MINSNLFLRWTKVKNQNSAKKGLQVGKINDAMQGNMIENIRT